MKKLMVLKSFVVSAALMCGFAAFAGDSGVSLAIEGTRAVITVAPNVVDSEGTVYLAYGADDFGESFDVWPCSTVVSEALTPAGGVFECELPDRRKFPDMKARAFVGLARKAVSLRSDGNACINLGETPAFDRRYEFRFRHVDVPSGSFALFGGVSRNPTKVFQVWGSGDPGKFSWRCDFSASVSDIVTAFTPEKEVVYDLRMDVAEGEQVVSWKRADEADYRVVGSKALSALEYTGNLLLFARADSARYVCDACAIYEYRVSKLSTGDVLKRLVPAVDANGRGQMVDAVSGTPYANVGQGGFFVGYGAGDVVACSTAAGYCGVSAKLKGSRLTVFVDSGYSDGRSALYLVWGETDAGTDASAWDHSACLLDSIPAEGLSVRVDLSTFAIPSKSVLRTLVVPRGDQIYCFGSDNGSPCIALGETVGPDRQFDMRIDTSGKTAIFMGGMDSNKSHIFQLYFGGDKFKVWFGDNVAHDVFAKEQSDDSQYDVRIILQEGDQRAYWKPATNEVYELGASDTRPSFQGGLNLAICGRGDGTGYGGDGSPRFGRFTETEISTGRVIRDLVPVRHDGSDFVYDFVTNKKLSLDGTFRFHPNTVGTVLLLGYADYATELFPAPKGGMMILVH